MFASGKSNDAFSRSPREMFRNLGTEERVQSDGYSPLSKRQTQWVPSMVTNKSKCHKSADAGVFAAFSLKYWARWRDLCLVAERRSDPWDLIVDPSGAHRLSGNRNIIFSQALVLGAHALKQKLPWTWWGGPFDGVVVLCLHSGVPMLLETLPAYYFPPVSISNFNATIQTPPNLNFDVTGHCTRSICKSDLLSSTLPWWMSHWRVDLNYLRQGTV